MTYYMEYHMEYVIVNNSQDNVNPQRYGIVNAMDNDNENDDSIYG